jgi:hypothetical protein
MACSFLRLRVARAGLTYLAYKEAGVPGGWLASG